MIVSDKGPYFNPRQFAESRTAFCDLKRKKNRVIPLFFSAIFDGKSLKGSSTSRFSHGFRILIIVFVVDTQKIRLGVQYYRQLDNSLK